MGEINGTSNLKKAISIPGQGASNLHGKQQDSDRGHETGDDDEIFDLDQFLFDKRSKLEHFFGKVYEELSSQPIFALHFFRKFSYHLANKGDGTDDHSFKILKKAFSVISQEDIEVFLFYETKNATDIVNELTGNAVQMTSINRQMRKFDEKIKESPNWRVIQKQKS